MATSVELRRYDYTSGGVYRTSESDSRLTITGIKLQVDSFSEAVVKEIKQRSVMGSASGATCAQRLTDLGKGSDVFTLKGTITKDSYGVNAVHTMLDLRYAVREWKQKGGGACTLVITDEADTGVTMTTVGLPLRIQFNYNAGFLDQYPFSLTFAQGVLSSA